MASLVLGGISLLSNLLGGNKKKQEENNTTTSNQQTSQNYNNTSTPNLSVNQQMLSDLFTSGAINKFMKGTDLSGYKADSLQNINKGTDLKKQLLRNSLASRGLAYSPFAGVVSNAIDSQGVGDQVKFANQLPLLQRQLQSDDLSDLIKSFSTLPTSVTSSGSSSGTSSGTQTQRGTGFVQNGSPWGSGLNDLGQILAAPSQYGGPSNMSSILKSIFG